MTGTINTTQLCVIYLAVGSDAYKWPNKAIWRAQKPQKNTVLDLCTRKEKYTLQRRTHNNCTNIRVAHFVSGRESIVFEFSLRLRTITNWLPRRNIEGQQIRNYCDSNSTFVNIYIDCVSNDNNFCFSYNIYNAC